MNSFEVRGKEFRSLKQCCLEFGISYSKARRLCRHYVRASNDPALAVRWCLGDEILCPTEPRTVLYKHDMNLSGERQNKFLEKASDRVKDFFED